MKNVVTVVFLAVFGTMLTTSDAQAQIFRRGSCVNGQCSLRTTSTQMVVPSVSHQSYTYEQPVTYSQSVTTSEGRWVKQCNNGVCTMVWVPAASASSVSSQAKVDTVVRDRPILGGTVVKNVITKSDPIVTTSSATAVPAPTVVSSVEFQTPAPVMATITTTDSRVSVGVTLLNL